MYNKSLKGAGLIIVLLFIELSFVRQVKCQNLFTKIYDTIYEYHVISISELADSSLLLNTLNYDLPSTRIFYASKYGDTLGSYSTAPSLLLFNFSIMHKDSLLLCAVQSLNSVIGIHTILLNPKTWAIASPTTYNVGNFAYPVCVYRAKNGDLLIGSTGPNAGVYGLIRTDSLFNVKWTQSCAGGAEHILEDSLGNILVSGSNVSQALKPFILNYFDSSGNLIWNRYYGNNVSFTGNISAASILILPDSNFIIVGEGGASPEYNFAKIARATGDTIYTRSLSYYYPRMALQISEDNIFTCSNKDFNFYNANGDLLYSQPFPIPQGKFSVSHIAMKTLDGGIVVAGITVPGSNLNVRLPTLIKIDTLGNSVPLSISDIEKINSQFSVYPNPVSGELHFYLPALLAQQDVTMSVYDATGRVVISSNQVNKCENETCTLDCSTLNNGFYSMVIQGKEGRYWQKFVVER